MEQPPLNSEAPEACSEGFVRFPTTFLQLFSVGRIALVEDHISG
jgi:hypothetical protein